MTKLAELTEALHVKWVIDKPPPDNELDRSSK